MYEELFVCQFKFLLGLKKKLSKIQMIESPNDRNSRYKHHFCKYNCILMFSVSHNWYLKWQTLLMRSTMLQLYIVIKQAKKNAPKRSNDEVYR